MAIGHTRVVQVTNIAPQATKDQMQTLFGYLGKIDDIRLYPTIRDVSCPVQSRICYVKYHDSSCVGVAQHLTNTVFIDRALIVIPMPNGDIPDEMKALEMSSNGTIVPGLQPLEPKLPSHVVNTVEGYGLQQIIQTNDPRLEENGLPNYPPLPGGYDPRKVEEIRRTVLAMELDPSIKSDKLIKHFSAAGEIKYVRMCIRDNVADKYALIEYTEQESIVAALKLHGSQLNGKIVKVYHSSQAIVKPETKSNEAAQREIEEAMCRVKEAQSLISAAIDPVIGMLSKDKSSSRHRSRSRSRERSRRRSRSRSRHRSRSKRRSRSKTRSRRSRSRTKRSRSKTKRSRSRSRSKRSLSRSKKSPSRSRKKSRSPSKRRSRSRTKRSRSRTKRSHSRSKRSRSKERKRRSVSKSSRASHRSRSRSKGKSSRHDKEKIRDKDRKKEEKKEKKSRRSRSKSRDRKRSKSRERKRSKSPSKSSRKRSRTPKESRKKSKISERDDSKVARNYDEEEKGFDTEEYEYRRRSRKESKNGNSKSYDDDFDYKADDKRSKSKRSKDKYASDRGSSMESIDRETSPDKSDNMDISNSP